MRIERDLPGIRVVRPLARDPHRESWLVRLDGDDPGPAVLVRPRDAHGARMVRLEAAALHRGRGTGVVALVDVVDDPCGLALVRAHSVGPRLAAVLAERQDWDAGEVVSALRPVVEAVERLHGSGVAHGALGAAEVVVTASGGVLVDLGHAELFEPGAPEAVLVRREAVGRDRDAVRALAVDALRRVTASRAQAARALADAIEQLAPAELLGALRQGLDDLAAPVPFASRDSEPSASSDSREMVRLMPVVRTLSDADARAVGPVDGGWRGAMRTRLGSLRARLDGLPAARRRLVVAGGAAVAAAAVLLALPTNVHDEGPHSPQTIEPPAVAEQGAAAAPAHPSTAAHRSTAVDAAIAGEDPIAAVVALLERRGACFAELSLLCLEGVDQQGSAALAADRAAIQALRDGQEANYRTVEAVEARIAERLGDSVLVEVGPQTAPASLLLMRSEAGWRIRDWLADDGVD